MIEGTEQTGDKLEIPIVDNNINPPPSGPDKVSLAHIWRDLAKRLIRMFSGPHPSTTNMPSGNTSLEENS